MGIKVRGKLPITYKDDKPCIARMHLTLRSATHWAFQPGDFLETVSHRKSTGKT